MHHHRFACTFASLFLLSPAACTVDRDVPATSDTDTGTGSSGGSTSDSDSGESSGGEGSTGETNPDRAALEEVFEDDDDHEDDEDLEVTEAEELLGDAAAAGAAIGRDHAAKREAGMVVGMGDRRFQGLAADIVEALSPLRAPLGVHGILGNHDWKDCDLTRETGFQRNSVIEAFAASGQPLLHNSSRHIPHGDTGFWLVGTDSQRIGRDAQRKYKSFLDAEAAFADVPEGAPAIHLAHEPDYFAEADPRAFLQLSGHTHGGQIKLFGRTPVVPSEFGERYVTGYTQESGNHLIVSDGIGFSGPPLRFGVPPEIVLITIGHWE